jgi:hypothetical protein
MTTNTLRPDGIHTDDADWVRTGGATKNGVEADDSDATYLATAALGDFCYMIFTLGTFSLPAGNRTKTIVVRVRAKEVSAGVENGFTVNVKNAALGIVAGGAVPITSTSFTTYTAATSAFDNQSQATIDGLVFELSAIASFSAIQVAECYVDIIHAAQPVANVTYPTGTPAITTTNTPTFTWTHTPGSDGGTQTHYEVRVFTAAQYGAGGFDPATSAAHWESGVVVGSASSQVSGPLANSTTYRVYVRTAQTINGSAHWSAFDFEGFSISVTTSDVSAITTTADSANGRILINVDRSGSAWDFVEVQRSIDTGTTWEYIRGGAYVPPATASAWSTGDANNFDIYDYEVPPATSTLYRARATRLLSGLPITGAWVQSTPAVSWTASEMWVKSPLVPSINDQFCLYGWRPQQQRQVRQGVHPVLGAANPSITFDVLSGRSGSITVATLDAAEAASLAALLDDVLLLLQFTASHGIAQMYVVVGGVSESFEVQVLTGDHQRAWDVSYVEVDAPSDPTAGVS